MTESENVKSDKLDKVSRLSESDLKKILIVIDLFEVGPVRVEKRRLVAPYTVTIGNKKDTIDLIYKFEEDVFDPDEPESVNLACMMAAQVALNYGLFCREILFHGLFNKHDRRFLEDMAKNTAREIYVKKLLEHNPFLVGRAAELPALKLDSYLFAKLKFSNETAAEHMFNNWQSDRMRYCVLSSGGKDSLLSFGLLRELGYEPHPIFVNESGRHWFTALNAYREFFANVPGTARVWTNADRIFAWMLRHLPFVRRDFANVRADEYPIRLWTVAVFLFGALPLLRKRGIGRLVIGDEYDTTARTAHKGITHYNGLYDQSRYFDNAMTRYFLQKGWNVTQFSVLRQLSEMLIEKILWERYPELQKLQVSCHATHSDGEWVRPCGKCEKCRRIVGMLLAINADPGNCGYSMEQIDGALADLVNKGVFQESEGVAQLGYMLKKKGLIPGGRLGSAEAHKHPEILKLRFDPERSPADGIPIDLRKPLFKIVGKHAGGAVQRTGRDWVEFNEISSAELDKPYFGDARAEWALTERSGKAPVDKTQQEDSYLLGHLTWPEVQKRLKQVDLALLPVGSTEQHGPHLPLDTDAFDADYLARQVAAGCRDPKPLVLPLVPFGVSYHHEDFCGTISISPSTLSDIVYEIGMSCAKHGIKKLIIINGHGGNTPALQFASQMINRDAKIFTCVDSGETSDTDIARLTETPNDVHAGEVETSTALAVRPELVRMDKAKKFVPKFSSRFLNFSRERSVEWFARTVKISQTGVMGDPTKASAEKGRLIWEVMIKRLTEFVEDIKSMNVEEIYQRRL
jgi:creatinine amidohydrolase/Fe(II)-dependent formamide hydrolase-like protein